MVDLAALALVIALAAQQPAAEAASAAQQAAADAALSADQAAADATAAAQAADAAMTGVTEQAAADQAAATVDVPKTEEMKNPYGLGPLWRQGDFIARGTLIILVIMSLGSWYIIFTKLWDQTRLGRQFRAADKGFWSGRSLQDGVNTMKGDNVFRGIAEQGINAAKHHEGRLTDQIPLHEWITQSLQRAVDTINNDLQSGMSFLATVGSTAPFVGLFGTVWGIYGALIAIGVAGQASIDKVAGPVGEALIMTALGLAVAVPAVLGYNWLLRRNKSLLEQVRYFATDVQAYLISGARVESPGSAASAAVRSK